MNTCTLLKKSERELLVLIAPKDMPNLTIYDNRRRTTLSRHLDITYNYT